TKFIKFFFQSIRNKILSTVSISLVILYFYFANDSPDVQIKKMKYIFEKGKINVQESLSNMPISRIEFEKSLKEILRPSLPYAYNLVMGDHGTGKTTLIQQAILNLKK